MLSSYRSLTFKKPWTLIPTQNRCVASQRFAAIMKLMNYQMTVDKENMEATVHTDGFQYADYDLKTTFPRAMSMLMLAESTAIYAHFTPTEQSGNSFRDFTSVMAGHTLFIVTSHMELCKALYDPSIPKAPILVNIKGGLIGNASNTLISTMYSNCGQELFRNAFVIVRIDTKTRKPAPFPEWWKLKYSKFVSEHKYLDFERLAIPYDPLRYGIRVRGSDLDFQGHATWANYMRYAEDAVYHYFQRDKFKKFKRDQSLKYRSLELMYSGESFEGESLKVLIWELDCEAGVIYAQIYKESTFIFQCRFEYFVDDV